MSCVVMGVNLKTKGYVLSMTPTKIVPRNIHRTFLGFATQGNQDVFIALGEDTPGPNDFYKFLKTDRMHFAGGIPISAVWAYAQVDGAVLVVGEAG
ncbi:hypothetical protein tf_60 [Pseudomonas phage tf]|uniref:Uncharacterized protein n=1 Tax=Pseudomonas phage tf TaxID=1114179 RepID=I2FLS9_9CAUD|nr:hypothetical protein tf_60 [Pseudomonas phage tf]CCE60813.1 hypothetical protein tf_60 [Pseudomonas phage tf]